MRTLGGRNLGVEFYCIIAVGFLAAVIGRQHDDDLFFPKQKTFFDSDCFKD